MAKDYKVDIEFDLNGKLSSTAINSIRNQIKSIGPVNVPVNYVVKGGGTTLTNVAKGMNTITKATKQTSKEIHTASKELESFGRQAALSLRRFSAFILVVSAFNKLTNSLQESFKRAVVFEKEMAKISQVTGTAYTDLRGLNNEITRLSTTLGVSSEKINKVALTLAQAGLSAEDTKKALDVLAKTELSATFENIENTTEAAIAVMAQFGTKAEDLKGQLSAINSVAAKFAVESGDLATVIRRAGGAFQATNGDLNELLALFTSVRATTRESAESISTGLRTIFTRLQRTRTLNFLDDLGISLRETDKQGRSSFIGIYRSIELLSEALKNIPGNDPRFNQIVEELGGFRQVSKVIPLLKEFETTQKAINVARRSSNSIDKDAIIAQQTLANQIARVGQEFDALIRKYLDDSNIRKFISYTLDLASALIKVGDAIRPLVPALGLIAGVGAFRAGVTISKAFLPGLLRRGPIGFNRGGSVPGHGNGDTVPAMLEPGEFVIRKSAVQAFGAGNLSKINKYATGGQILDFIKKTRRLSAAQGAREFRNIRDKGFFQAVFGGPESDSISNQLGGLKNTIVGGISSGIGKIGSGIGAVRSAGGTLTSSLKSVGGSLTGGLKTLGNRTISGAKGIGRSLFNEFAPPPLNGPPLNPFNAGPSKNKLILDESLLILQQLQKDLGVKFSKDLVQSIRVTDNLSAKNSNAAKVSKQLIGAFNPYTKSIEINSSRIKNKAHLRKLLYHELGHAIDVRANELAVKKALGSTVIKPDFLSRSLPGPFYNISNEAKTASALAAKYGKLKKIRDNRRGLSFDSDKAKYRYSQEESFAEAFRFYASNPKFRAGLDKAGFADILKLVSARKMAKGGAVGTDTQPALLTPGEFVINKRSAQAFGYGNLSKINKYAIGGKVGAAAIGTGLAIGPQLLDQFLNTDESIKPFLTGLTVAGAALTAFAFIVKRNTEVTETGILAKNEEDIELAKRLSKLKKEETSLGTTIKAGTTNLGGSPVLDAKATAASAKLIKNRTRQKSLTDRREELSSEIDELTDKIVRDKRFNKIAGRVAIGAAVASGVGATLGSFAQSNAEKGVKSTFGVKTQDAAALGGFLSGGANGALLGLALGGKFGLPGALTGAGVGALFGTLSSYNQADTSLNQFKLSEDIKDLNKSLESVSSGKSTIGAQRQNIRGQLSTFNKLFITSSDEDLQSIKSQIDNSINGIEELFKEAARTSKSLADFRRENDDLILSLSRFGGQTIIELERQAEDLIKAQKVQNEITKQSNTNAFQLENIFKISGAVGDAERSIQGLSDSLLSLDNIISGTFGPSSFNPNFSALGQIGNARQSDINFQARLAGNLIGGPAVGLSQEVIKAADLSAKVPALLSESVNGKQLEGDDIRDRFRKALGEGLAANLIIEAVNKEIGNTGSTTELIKKFGEDPVGLAKRIQSAIDPLVEGLTEATPQIIEQFDSFSQGLAAARGRFFEVIERRNQIIDTAQLRENINAGAFGKIPSFANTQAFEQQRFANIAGGVFTPAQLGARLANATSNIQSLQALRGKSTDQNEIIALTKQIEENTKEAERSTKALDYLSDVNARLADVEKERQRLQATRENLGGLAKSFVFGDPAAQKDIFKGLLGVKTIQGNLQSGANPFQGLSSELKTLSLQILEQFSSDKLFGGKTGQEIINEVISKKLGIDFGKPAGEEAKLLQISNDIITTSQESLDVLAKHLSDNNDKFVKGLDEKLTKFFSELSVFFKERADKANNDVLLEKKFKGERLDEQIGTLQLLGKATGLNPNDPKSLDTVRKAIDDINKAKEKDRQALSIDVAKNQFLKTGKIDGLERILGSDFIKKLQKERADFRAARGFIPNGLDEKSVIDNFITKEVDKTRDEASILYKDVQERLGGSIKGLLDNLDKLSKGLEDINDRVGLKDLQGQRVGLARGGLARGTDTVPAMTTDGRPYMLTPGEFIMSRKAVQKYGLGFMERINYSANGSRVSQFGENIFTGSPVNSGLNNNFIKSTGNPNFPYSYKGVKYASLRAAQLAAEGRMGTTNPTILEARQRRGVRPDGSSFDTNNMRLSIGGNPSLQNNRFLFQREFNQGIKSGLSRADAFTNAAAKTGSTAKNPFTNSTVTNKQLQGQNAGQPQQNVIAPEIMKDFNKAVNVLSGSKLELSITGTIDVRIIEGNLSKDVEGLFQTAVQAYVDKKVIQAINTFANQNGLPAVPVPVGLKAGEK